MENKETKSKLPKPVKIIIYAVVAVLLCLLVYFSFQNRKKAAYRIAYTSDIPEAVIEELRECMDRQFVGKIDYIELSDSYIPSKKCSSQFDLLLTQKGKKSRDFKAYAKEFIPVAFDSIPEYILTPFNEDGKYMELPLLYDPYIIASLKNTDRYFNLSIPEDTEEWESFLLDAKKIVSDPLYFDSGDDKTLLAFLSSLLITYGGPVSYKNFAESAMSYPEVSFEELCSLPLGSTSSGEVFSFNSVLTLLKFYFNEKLFTPSVNNADETEDKMENRSAYIVYSSLSDFSALKNDITSNYSFTTFPQDYSFEDMAVTAPSIIALNFSKKEITATVARYLTLTQTQNLLSRASNLVPSASSSTGSALVDFLQSYTTWCTYGPLPDLYTYSFEKETARTFAEEVRKCVF